jgi:hypothetical protein
MPFRGSCSTLLAKEGTKPPVFRKAHFAELTIVQLKQKNTLTNISSVRIICAQCVPVLRLTWSFCRPLATYYCINPRVKSDSSEISCSYSKPAGRLSNSWGCRARNCRSGMNVRYNATNLKPIIDASGGGHIVFASLITFLATSMQPMPQSICAYWLCLCVLRGIWHSSTILFRTDDCVLHPVLLPCVHGLSHSSGSRLSSLWISQQLVLVLRLVQ